MAAMAAAALLAIVPHAASAAPAFPINATGWIAVAFAAVLLVIAIAAFVYMLAGFINSSRARAWALSQIYSALLSIVLLLIFLFFVYLFYINPQTAFQSACLVPIPGGASAACPPSTPNGASTNIAPDCSATNTIFALSACDMYYFNQNAFSATEVIYVIAFFAGFSPGISVEVHTEPQVDGISVGAALPDFVPADEVMLLSGAFAGLFFALILNQLQSIVLSAALLWLSLFLVIGLVARCFGITRSFGGSMIAFGLGLGLVYPLLVAILYGFINVHIGYVDVGGSLQQIIPLVFSAVLAVLSGQVTNAGLAIFDSAFVTQMAYLIAGLTFIPFLVFTILDAFIRDFSRLIGQQIDFMSLMGGLI